MPFYVDQRFTKIIRLLNRDGTEFNYAGIGDNPEYYWIFDFIDARIKDKISGSVASRGLAFNVTEGFFARERVGRLRWKVLVRDGNDNNPSVESEQRNDELIYNGPTPTELGI